MKTRVQFFIAYIMLLLVISMVGFNSISKDEKSLTVSTMQVKGVLYLKSLYKLSVSITEYAGNNTLKDLEIPVSIDNKPLSETKKNIINYIDELYKLQKETPAFKNDTLNEKLEHIKLFQEDTAYYYEFLNYINRENYVIGDKSHILFEDDRELYFLCSLLSHYMPEYLISILITHNVVEGFAYNTDYSNESKKIFIEQTKLMYLSSDEIHEILTLLSQNNKLPELNNLERKINDLLQKIKPHTESIESWKQDDKVLQGYISISHEIIENSYKLEDDVLQITEQILNSRIQNLKSNIVLNEFLFLFLATLLSITFFYYYRSTMSNLKQDKEIKKINAMLENQYMFLQKIIDLVPLAIFWKDMDGTYLGANKQFVKDAQLNDISEIIGKTDYDMTWRKDAKRFIEDDASVVNSGVPRLLYEEEQPKEDGSCIYLVTSKVPLRDTDDNIIGILGVYNDITEHKMLQHDSKEKDKLLLVQSRMAQMGEMISMIAHQWRQPLAAISSTSIDLNVKIELETFNLEKEKGREECKTYVTDRLKNIDGFVQSLSSTIDDFRNFYKPNKKTDFVLLYEPVSNAINIIKASFASDGIEIVETCQMHNKKVKLYANELIQVILNIFKNSHDNFKEKKTKDPKIIITCKCSSDDKVTIEICDNGGGIPEDILPKIFDPYFSTKNEKNGTGLGLYMSKIIIEEHHNGKLTLVNTDDGLCCNIELGIISEKQKI